MLGYPSGLAAALPAAVDAVAEVAVELATEEAELPPQAVNAADAPTIPIAARNERRVIFFMINFPFSL
ncbi:MAG TPA: chemotaxis protein [Faecalibacterium sp.]|nr:chemotaxis protein [Faecalibacterium sp.]